MDPYEKLGLSLTINQDGTISCNAAVPLSPAFPDGESLHNSTITVRLFLPSLPPSKSFPLIICFHGGGFVLFQAASAPFHASCAHFAASLPSLPLLPLLTTATLLSTAFLPHLMMPEMLSSGPSRLSLLNHRFRTLLILLNSSSWAAVPVPIFATMLL